MKYSNINGRRHIFDFIMMFIFFPIFGQNIHQESILDRKESVQDSIYYHIDSLLSLYKKLNMKGQYIDIGDCKFIVK